jgi:hypothetical protein
VEYSVLEASSSVDAGKGKKGKKGGVVVVDKGKKVEAVERKV